MRGFSRALPQAPRLCTAGKRNARVIPTWDRGAESNYERDGTLDNNPFVPEITDKDRNPHLYYDWTLQKSFQTKVVDKRQDFFPERIEALRWSQLTDLEDRRGNYLNLTQAQIDQAGIGYITEEDPDPYAEADHPEYTVGYQNASEEYKAEVLECQCEGRPAYEWQIPAGFAEMHGYPEALSVVDAYSMAVTSERDPNSYSYTSMGAYPSAGGKSVLLRNEATGQELIIVQSKYAAKVIREYGPDVVALQWSAEKNLDRAGTFKGTSRYALQGCLMSGIWSFLWWANWWPVTPAGGAIALAMVLGGNGYFLQQTFLHPDHTQFKGILKAARENDSSLLLADWLKDDIYERKHRVFKRDQCFRLGKHHPDDLWMHQYYWQQGLELNVYLNEPAPTIKDAVGKDLTATTYAEAIQLKRMDVIANALSNNEGMRTVLAVKDTGCYSSEVAVDAIAARLTGEVPVKDPFHFDEGRVTVVF